MTYKRALLYRIPLVILSTLGLLYLIVQTPLRQYLPGYLDQQKRALVEQMSMRIDSLEEVSRVRLLYLNNMVAILSGEAKGELVPYDSAASIIQDTLLQASELERTFAQQYEERERFTLSGVSKEPADRRPIFLAPIKGVVDVSRALSPNRGIDIKVLRETPVLAPLEGSVVSVSYVAGEGFHVVIQHPGDYLTLFSGLSVSLVEVGQTVKPGRVIGHAGGKGATSERSVNVQIWYKGSEIDPLSVMNY
ncbi:MAG: M23 family metallopeptidase [Bacteroidales bacterium]|nr:M23 family metallopeptidase [Bacteroidales bacterium]